MELNTTVKLLAENIELSKENENLKKELESAKNSDSNLAYAMGVSDENENLERKVGELEEKMKRIEKENEYLGKENEELEQRIEGLEQENWMLSSQLTHEAREDAAEGHCSSPDEDNLIYVSPNFQYVLQHATDEHMEKQAEMILKLYELVFASNAARKQVKAANGKLFEFMENGLNKGVQ